MCVSLWSASKAEPQATEACRSLAGSLVSSLHRLKDIDNNGETAFTNIFSMAADILNRRRLLCFWRHFGQDTGGA